MMKSKKIMPDIDQELFELRRQMKITQHIANEVSARGFALQDAAMKRMAANVRTHLNHAYNAAHGDDDD